jgi:hypothetical protein
VDLGGSGLHPVTRSGGAAGGRFDDLDPCWIGDSTLCFASTRDAQRTQYADLPVTNLFVVAVADSGRALGEPHRITAERNGAEEPAMDWRRGRIVFARWWLNAHRPANTPSGLAADTREAIPADSVNLWQTMEVTPGLHRERLAAGDLRTRRGEMGYQPAVFPDGSIAAVYAANLGMSPAPGGTGIHLLPPRFGPAIRLAGAIVAGRADDVYGSAGELAPPSACSPAALPDGRVLFSYSPGARGDLGLFVVGRDGSGLTRVLDLPGTLELDAVPVVRQPEPRPETMPRGDELESPHAIPGARMGVVLGSGTVRELPRTFRFHDLDVFADGPAGSPAHGAPPRTAGARLRFFATLPRPASATGDTAVLLREVPVGPGGEVNEDGLPAGQPLFEPLVDAQGHVLMGAHGPAHVAGLNAGVQGLTTRCVGCHLGHSTLPVPATPRVGTVRP